MASIVKHKFNVFDLSVFRGNIVALILAKPDELATINVDFYCFFYFALAIVIRSS